MIRHIRLLRNIGQFDSVDAGSTIALSRLVLIYAENGRGKTTLGAVLRSLATGDPIPIIERRRLAAAHSPHVVLDCEGGPSEAVFLNGEWNRTLPRVMLFDDIFVDENVHSGLVIHADHRQKLHELVLGAQGVALSRRIRELVGCIEVHNRVLREKAGGIPEADRGGLSVDDFCALKANPEIEREIQETERALAAAREQEPVRKTPRFQALELPGFDLDAIEHTLRRDLPSLDPSLRSALELVRAQARDPQQSASGTSLRTL